MSPLQRFLARRAGTLGAVAAVVLHVAVNAHAQSNTEGKRSPGRIDFEAVDLPAASVEVDLSQGMVRDLFGIGDAAVAGVAESLLQSPEASNGSGATRLAAEQLAAARQIMQLASEVIQEVRVRAYRRESSNSLQPETLAAQFDSQLRNGNWENVVRVRKDDQSVRVSLLRNDGALQGVFVIVGGEGEELVLANVVSDISPENVKKLTSAATKIGLENGLAQVIEAKLAKRRGIPQAGAPEPPRANQ